MMKGPKKYRQQIKDLGIEGMEIDVSSIDVAMNTLNELDEMEKILKKIRHNIRTDTRKIRLDYIRRIQEVEDSSGIFGRKKSTEKKIKEKKSLIKERNIEVSTYEVVEDTIDGYISQIESSRIYIMNSIQDRVGNT